MKVYLGADHRGYKLKEQIKKWLEAWGMEYQDMGNIKLDVQDDFPDYAKKVAEKVQNGGKGILLCGSGGMAMVANKFKGVYAVEAWNIETAKHAKAHDDANVLILAADFISDKQAKKMVEAWLNAKVKQDKKYQRRLAKIKQIEKEQYA